MKLCPRGVRTGGKGALPPRFSRRTYLIGVPDMRGRCSVHAPPCVPRGEGRPAHLRKRGRPQAPPPGPEEVRVLRVRADDPRHGGEALRGHRPRPDREPGRVVPHPGGPRGGGARLPEGGVAGLVRPRVLDRAPRPRGRGGDPPGAPRWGPGPGEAARPARPRGGAPCPEGGARGEARDLEGGRARGT